MCFCFSCIVNPRPSQHFPASVEPPDISSHPKSPSKHAPLPGDWQGRPHTCPDKLTGIHGSCWSQRKQHTFPGRPDPNWFPGASLKALQMSPAHSYLSKNAVSFCSVIRAFLHHSAPGWTHFTIPPIVVFFFVWGKSTSTFAFIDKTSEELIFGDGPVLFSGHCYSFPRRDTLQIYTQPGVLHGYKGRCKCTFVWMQTLYSMPVHTSPPMVLGMMIGMHAQVPRALLFERWDVTIQEGLYKHDQRKHTLLSQLLFCLLVRLALT